MNVEPLSEHVGTVISCTDHADILELDTDKVIEWFRTSGAVLFRGFDIGVKKFEEFTNRFSSDYMDNTGSGSYRETINRDGDGTIQSVSYSFGRNQQRTFGLPLHADRSYTKSQPPMMWFYCVRPAKLEGETIICDGAAIYRNLSDSTRSLLEQKRLRYIRDYPDGQWQVLYHTDDLREVERFCLENDFEFRAREDGSIHTEFTKPAIVRSKWGSHDVFVNSILIVQWQEDDLGRTVSKVRLEDGSRIPDDVLDEVKSVSSRLTYDIKWQADDLLMLDNTRLMHGRRSFDDPGREIYVRMCRSVEW
jgi:alpha-ketoglutarate-dependent taurine dioxygenase